MGRRGLVGTRKERGEEGGEDDAVVESAKTRPPSSGKYKQ